tara:strand:+ start:682 stop:942 length:261 start_codon:yes stop_codon:yes gene_type:complete
MAAKLVGFAPSKMASARELLGAATASGSRCFSRSRGGVSGKWRSGRSNTGEASEHLFWCPFSHRYIIEIFRGMECWNGWNGGEVIR